MRNDLLLYVPTIKRVEFQFVLKGLPKKWLARTVLVCPQNEVKEHKRNWPGLGWIEAPPLNNIAEVRAWIFRKAKSEKILVMDDDLMFSIRHNYDKLAKAGLGGVPRDSLNVKYVWSQLLKKDKKIAKLDNLNADDPRMDQIFKTVEKTLDTYRHMGISERFFNNAKAAEFTKNTKLLHALAYHVPSVVENCELGWTKWNEDVDYTIQMLLAGFENVCWNWAAVNEGRGWNASGGCSSYRKVAEQEACSKAQEKKYPKGVVMPYVKESKIGPMWVVRVNWKKAIQHGQSSASEFI